jgi:hypothetical protein
MDRRGSTRIAASHAIPVRVFGMGDLLLDMAAHIVNVSPNGLRLSASQAIRTGSLLRIEFEDAAIFAEVRYCQRQKQGFAIGLFVEEILISTSELARLVASLVNDSPDRAVKEPVRSR